MKRVRDLKPGDVVTAGGLEFVVHAVANLPNGKTTVLFEDVPATPEYVAAYGELLKIMKEQKEKDDEG